MQSNTFESTRHTHGNTVLRKGTRKVLGKSWKFTKTKHSHQWKRKGAGQS